MKKAQTVFKGFFFSLLLVAALASCGYSVANNAPSGEAAKRRIVSLIPSLTEDLFAVGAGPQIVAVDKFSTDIKGAQKLPAVGDFSSVDTERIIALHPDVVVGIPAQGRLVEPLRRAGISVVLFRDDSFEDLFSDLDGLGVLSGHLEQARKVENALKARTQALHKTIHFKRVPSVFIVLDTNPIYTAGKSSYIGSLIRLAGGKNAADTMNTAFAPYSAEALLRSQPDAIVTDPSTGLQTVLKNEPWRSLRAVAKHHVFVIATPDVLERPGPRYNEGLAWLIARLQPLAQ